MLIWNSKKYDIMITSKLFTTTYNNEILIRRAGAIIYYRAAVKNMVSTCLQLAILNRYAFRIIVN